MLGVYQAIKYGRDWILARYVCRDDVDAHINLAWIGSNSDTLN